MFMEIDDGTKAGLSCGAVEIAEPGERAARQWYVAAGRPYEARRRLAQLASMGVGLPVDLFIPVERTTVNLGRGRRQAYRDTPLFGPYFFVGMDLSRRDAVSESLAGKRLAAFRAIDGVHGFLGNNASGWPRPVTDDRMFMDLRQAPVVQRETPRVRRGDLVRVTNGALAGHVGPVAVLLGRLDSRQRVRVLLAMLGGSVPVEVSTDHVEIIARAG